MCCYAGLCKQCALQQFVLAMQLRVIATGICERGITVAADVVAGQGAACLPCRVCDLNGDHVTV